MGDLMFVVVVVVFFAVTAAYVRGCERIVGRGGRGDAGGGAPAAERLDEVAS